MTPKHMFAKSMVSAMTQPAALIGADGVIVVVNDGFSASLSIETGAVVGANIAECLDHDDKLAVHDFLNTDGAQFGAPVITPTSQHRLSLNAVFDAHGQQYYLCQVAPDHAIENSRLRFLLEHLDEGVWNYDVITGLFTVTDAWRRMRGVAMDENINLVRKGWGDWLHDIHEDDRAPLQTLFDGQIEGTEQNIEIQYRRKHSDGHWVWILCRASIMSYDQNGSPVQIVGLDTDISNIKENEAKLSELASKMQLAIDVAGIGVWEYDSSTTQVQWDDRLLEIYGVSDKMYNRPGELWETYLHPDDRVDAVADADLCLLENRDFRRDYRIVRETGEVRHLRSLARFVQVAGTGGKLLGVNIDITDDVRRTDELEKARQQLEHDSRHDALTGLANRRLLDETTQTLLARLAPQERFAVLHLDLDFFKKINDTLGHAAGDAALVYVSEGLSDIIGDAGLVCRNGGDEFVVLLYSAPSRDDVGHLCQTIIDRVAEPLMLQGQMNSFSVSIGAAIGTNGLVDMSETFINADVALYAAKSDGRSCYRLFKSGMAPASQRDALARQGLLDALQNGEITCFYQPQFDAHTLKMIGAEALVRWNCPVRGVVLPDQFMPLAQSAGLVPQIDDYIFKNVLRQQTIWMQQGMVVPTISLNISRERLEERGLARRVIDALEAHHSIAFELLETSFMDDAGDEMTQTLDALRDAGICLDLDDFGSGHSSIVALQALRPDRVKIDRGLVAPLSHSRTQILTLQALTRLAVLEGAGVIVEGIETQCQLEAMSQLNCEALQGFVLARPMPAQQFVTYLDEMPQSASQ